MSSIRIASEEASSVLSFFDRLANLLQKNPKFVSDHGLSPTAAKIAMSYLDKSADDFEKKAFGGDSFAQRQAEVFVQADADTETEPDEPYMAAYDNPQNPIQTESDEPYMGEFNTDTSSEVRQQYPSGKFTPRQSSDNPFA